MVSDKVVPPAAEPRNSSGQVARSESIRRWLSPLIALAASALAMTCTVSLLDVLGQVNELAATSHRFAGWVALGSVLTMASMTVAVALSRHLGSGPSLSLGAAAAVFGLALGHQVLDDRQIALAFSILGVSVGCLLGGGVGLMFELPLPLARLSLVAWALPLMAVWPVQAWFVLHHSPEALRLTLHPSVWLLAPVAAGIVFWSVATMLLEPPQAARTFDGWQDAWSALVLVFAVVGLVAMLLGFALDIRPYWLRPFVLMAAVLAVSGWALAAKLTPSPLSRLAMVSVSFVAASVPALVQLLLRVADAGQSRVSSGVVGVLVVAVVVGTVLGRLRPWSTLAPGFLMMAAAAAGAWVTPGDPWWMVASMAPFAAAGTAVFVGGLTLATESPAGLGLVAVAAVGALTLGLLLAAPLGWALTGDVPLSVDDARAAGRVMLGIVVATALPLAAYTSVLQGRRD